MLVNYLADCPGVATASATMKAQVDVWVNDVMFFPSDKGEFVVPNMMYHDVPTVVTVETLKDVLLSEKEQLQACETQTECPADYYNPRRVCAGGFCRAVAMKYTVSFADPGAKYSREAAVGTDAGASGRETVLIKPVDADDAIISYSQALQGYAGEEDEQHAKEMIHNNKPLEMQCEHCYEVCATVKHKDGSTNFLRSLPGLDRFDCQNECYADFECVAMNYNHELQMCDLFSKCEQMTPVKLEKQQKKVPGDGSYFGLYSVGSEVDGVVGSLKNATDTRRLQAASEQLDGGRLEAINARYLAEEEAQKVQEAQVEKAAMVDDPKVMNQKLSYNATMQKITSDEKKEVEEIEVPSVMRGLPVGDYMVFKRPAVDYTKYVAPEKHLLKFGGTEYGSIELVGQPGDQPCWLNAHSGQGVSSIHTRYVKATCTADTASMYIYASGRGVAPGNFVCKPPRCEDKSVNDPKACASFLSNEVAPMKTIDTLGTMRSTVEIKANFMKPVAAEFTCTSYSLDKKEAYELIITVAFSPHKQFGSLLSETFAELNNPSYETYAVGFTPACRDAKLRDIFGSNSQCEQIPKYYDPAKSPNLRFVCPKEQSSSITVNPVVEDATAKVEYNGLILRNMQDKVATDGRHGGSHFGGVDFYYPITGMDIAGDDEFGVKTFSINTFCDTSSRTYNVILQNGFDLVPEITGLSISQGDNCVMEPKQFNPAYEGKYVIKCPQTTKWIGIKPMLRDAGVQTLVNGKPTISNAAIDPIRLQAGQEHTWNLEFKPPIDPMTQTVVTGYKPTSNKMLVVKGIRFAPFGLGDRITKGLANVFAVAGIGLAVVSSANFMGVAKFLQFLGFLVAIHGMPDAFVTFAQSFSKVNLQFNHIDDMFPNLKKYVPNPIKKFQKLAAQAAGLPTRALAVLTKHSHVATGKMHEMMAGHHETLAKKGEGLGEEAAKKLAEAQAAAKKAKEELEEVAAIRRKYQKQYIKFKENMHKFKESFARQKGLLANLFLLPSLLFILAVFYTVRYFLRVILPGGCFGYEWDQVAV
jgi:hypothetical protein